MDQTAIQCKSQSDPSVYQSSWSFGKCRHAIDSLIIEKSYKALTTENICERAGLPVGAIEVYFGSTKVLLKMHEELCFYSN